MPISENSVSPFITTYKQLIDFFLPTPDSLENKEAKLFSMDMFELFDKELVERTHKLNKAAFKEQREEISRILDEKVRYSKLKELKAFEKEVQKYIDLEHQNIHEIAVVPVKKEVAQQFLYNSRRKAVIDNPQIDPIVDLTEFILMVDKVGVIRQGKHFLLGYTLYPEDVLVEAEKNIESKYYELHKLLVIENKYVTPTEKFRDLPESY